MTLDPHEVVKEMARHLKEHAASAPPGLLQRSADPQPPLSPMRQSDQITEVHREWARVHAPQEEGSAGTSTSAGVRAKVRARVATAAAEVARSSQQDDRVLIGDLIRAVDALATRSDQLADRLGHLESVVEEVIAVLGEDIVQQRAMLQGPLPGEAGVAPSDRPAADG